MTRHSLPARDVRGVRGVRGRLRPRYAAAVSLLAITGCAGGVNCTDIGADSGVSVTYDQTPGTTYRLCADEICERWTAEEPVPSPAAPHILHVVLPDAKEKQTVSVRFTATRAGESRAVIDEQATSTLRPYSPNGPECDPTVHIATFRHTAGEGLVKEARDYEGAGR
ncbi:hypothetical protein [Streptomyces sp. NPDC004726]